MSFTQKTSSSDIVSTEYDQASGEYFDNITATNGEGEVAYVGMDSLLNLGLSPQQFNALTDALASYAKKSNINLFRVSYVKNSFSVPQSYIFNFQVVLNVDQNNLKIVMDSTAGYGILYGLKIYFYSESGDQVFDYIIIGDLACDKYNICDSSD